MLAFANTRVSCSLPSSSASQPGKIANVLKKALPVATHENIYTIPNVLTASRLVLAPVIGYCILHDYHAWTLGLFAYAGITDLLDGWIARKWNQGTVVGTVIDPMADKTLMTVLTVALAMKGGLPGEWMLTPSLDRVESLRSGGGLGPLDIGLPMTIPMNVNTRHSQLKSRTNQDAPLCVNMDHEFGLTCLQIDSLASCHHPRS